jgi:hypothetical protein
MTMAPTRSAPNAQGQSARTLGRCERPVTGIVVSMSVRLWEAIRSLRRVDVNDLRLAVYPAVNVTLAANSDKRFRLRLDRVKRSFTVFATVGAMLLAATACFEDTFGQVANAALSKTSNSALVANFSASMKKADGSRFVLTYHVGGYPVLAFGKIVVAEIPSPPGTKVTKNADGYSGTGRMAYVFHGPSGRIVQWIQDGTNVSACVNVLLSGTYIFGTFGKLECSRPSPYLPSNGFAEEGVGFVPTYVDSQLTAIQPTRATISTKSSQFGTLRCLVQTQETTIQTTCINHAGFVVSWFLQDGMGSFSKVILSALTRDPTASDFKPLITPTKALILPPV